MESPIWPICSSAGSPILKRSFFKVRMVWRSYRLSQSLVKVQCIEPEKRQALRAKSPIDLRPGGRKERLTFFSTAFDGF